MRVPLIRSAAVVGLFAGLMAVPASSPAAPYDCSPYNSGPLVITGAATNITTTSATLNGSVNPAGSTTTWWFRYGTNPNNLTSVTPTQTIPAGYATVNVHANITGLTPNTTYYYELFANPDSCGVTDGLERSFTTLCGSSFCPGATASFAQRLNNRAGAVKKTHHKKHKRHRRHRLHRAHRK